MKKTVLTAALFALATIAVAGPPPIKYTIEANFQQEQELPPQEFVQGAGVSLRYILTSGNKYWTLNGLGA